MVMTAVPVSDASGVTATVRFVPVPPKTTFASGTRLGLDDEPVTEIVALELSVIVNGIGPVDVLGKMVRSDMPETVSGVPSSAITSCGRLLTFAFSREA